MPLIWRWRAIVFSFELFTHNRHFEVRFRTSGHVVHVAFIEDFKEVRLHGLLDFLFNLGLYGHGFCTWINDD